MPTERRAPVPARDSRLIWFVSITILLNVVAFTLLGLLTREALGNAAVNTRRIEINAYKACTDLNRGFTRSNATIDSAIAAERRKPAPDAKRLHDLTNFRLPIRACGPNPARR